MPLVYTPPWIATRLPLALFLLVLLLAFATAPAHAQIADTANTNDLFGVSVATGDFDGDGYDDLAVGVPGENNDAGAVNVIYGSSGLLTQTGNRWFSPNELENGDRYGQSLAAGNFNGDSYDDLAIGVPRRDVGGAGDAGELRIMYGSANGLSTAANLNQTIIQSFIGESNNPDDLFGWALVAADFDGNGRDDLAVGIPFKDVSGLQDVGAVAVIYGTTAGLSVSMRQVILQSDAAIANEAGDLFGYSLAAGYFNGDSFAELSIGIPGEDVGTTVDTGFIIAMGGGQGGLNPSGSVRFQEGDFAGGSTDAGNQFGFSLVSGDFDGDGFGDVAAGSPFDDLGGSSNVGRIGILYGTETGGLTTNRSQIIDQDIFGNNTEAGDQFGFSLASGDFSGDGRDDLVIGAPYEDLGSTVDAGLFGVLYGTASGLSGAGSAQFRQDQFGNSSVSEGDLFSYSLAAGDFNGDGVADAVIGTPLEDHGPATDAGAVNILYGLDGSGLNIGVNQLIYQGAGIFVVADEDDPANTALTLRAPAPNPFRGATTLRFDLATAGEARMTVYDLLGHQVAVLADGAHAAGSHEVTFDASGLAAGVYIARLETGGDVRTTRLTVVR